MKRRGAVLLFAVVAALGLWLAPAGATGHHHHGRILVVDNQPRHHRSCLGTRHPYDTIQGAVDVAPSGATIWVCPGLYIETVKVQTPRLTIKGANAGRDASGPRGRESVVTHPDSDPDLDGTVQLLADDITWDGFTVLGVAKAVNGPGISTSPSFSGYVIRDTIVQDNGVGLHLGSSGERLTFVCGNRFVANNEVDAGGFGIFSDKGARQVLITYNRFEGHNGAGIFFADRGAPQQRVRIDHNKSVGDLSFATIYATTQVRLTHNSATARVGDKDFPGPASAIFIGARTVDVLVERNRVHAASGNGIDVTDSPEPHQGGGVEAPKNVVVSKNKAEHAVFAGLHMAGGTSGVQVTANTALGNKLWDCQDESTGLKNTWAGNLGVTDSPDGICTPPATTEPPVHGGKHHHKKHKQPDPCSCRRHPRAF